VHYVIIATILVEEEKEKT